MAALVEGHGGNKGMVIQNNNVGEEDSLLGNAAARGGRLRQRRRRRRRKTPGNTYGSVQRRRRGREHGAATGINGEGATNGKGKGVQNNSMCCAAQRGQS